MLVEQGYGIAWDRFTGKILFERPYFSCAHCQTKVEMVTLRSHEFSTCYNCDDGKGRGLICNNCVGKPCVPFQKKLDIMEARARFRSMI